MLIYIILFLNSDHWIYKFLSPSFTKLWYLLYIGLIVFWIIVGILLAELQVLKNKIRNSNKNKIKKSDKNNTNNKDTKHNNTEDTKNSNIKDTENNNTGDTKHYITKDITELV